MYYLFSTAYVCITLASKFSTTYRYIDDLLCINNEKFELSISDIYYHVKREDFNFDIVNFPHLDSNIPNTPALSRFSYPIGFFT